ncbi:family 78 glycoside hydrolase catalytic domain [Dyadobacter aurulentus]|uniref:family 78 glycoside hydrolase catalytic domain n=1 Tax=Dyadobacter sp. UC 10 TaxID=2605428 RepID=UPI0011F33D58|nr:family 78 glycoside hydrolase catalytic domain [Dyadobacter sp. UC 10]KAA0993645.1 Bacterial alpha-L-rhamnosidase [Dyadobacter sp. UC 10]
MKIFFAVILSFLTVTSFSQSAIRVTVIKCESRQNPLGIETPTPSLSWQMESDKRAESQSAYQIVVSDQADFKPENANYWDSGKKESDQSIHVRYAGKQLSAAKRYYWKVRVWDKTGQPSKWSAAGYWQMGLPSKSDWGKAAWLALTPWTDSMRVVPGIHVPHNNPKFGKKVSGAHPLPMFRRDIRISKKLKRATAFITGLGHYEFSINGKNADTDFLSPGWTNYDEYTYYNTIDITGALKPGRNALGVMLGNGFYNVPNERYRKLLVAYGNPKMICKVLLEYQDGSTEEIVSDETWKVTESPVTYSSIYGGEDYDATREQKGWNLPGFDDSKWKKPLIVNKEEKLVAQIGYPMAVMDTFNVARISQPKPGVWVYDMGQNASAIPQLTVSGKAGTQVKITPAELILDDGTVNQQASGEPHFYQYTLNNEKIQTWQPKFTYYGFRYIQLEGAMPEGEANPNTLPVVAGVSSLHVRSAAPRTGSFSCSNDLFNRIYALINWAINSNVTHTVTDCPHREKLGWLEETYLMGNSIQLNLDMELLNKKLFSDMRSAQLKNGLVPDIVPEYVPFEGGFRDSPEWGSASVILPWYCYQWYGDKSLLLDNYEMMVRYVDYLTSKSNQYILMHGLGDWFDMGPGPMGESQLTPKGLTPTATYYYNATILAKIAAILGKQADIAKFTDLAANIKKAFNQKFYDKTNHQYGTGSQTANAMAVYLGLAGGAEQDLVYKKLNQNLVDNNYVLTAGDIGFHYLVKVLSEGGASDVLFKMNNRNDVPGYGYQLAHGATALTESWPALRNVSNNHLMLGHLMEWFYEGIGGIRQAETSIGYKNLIIQPQFPGDLTEAKASYQSPYGTISTSWRKEERYVTVEVQVPVNANAALILPVAESAEVTENGKGIVSRPGITIRGKQIFVGSGKYNFRFKN